MKSDSENSDSEDSLIFNDSSDSDNEGDLTNDDVFEEKEELTEKIQADEKLIKDIEITEKKLENEFEKKPKEIETLITNLKEQQKELQKALESEKETLKTLESEPKTEESEIEPIKTLEEQKKESDTPSIESEQERIEYKPEEINENEILTFKSAILIMIDPPEQLCSQEALDNLKHFFEKQKNHKTLTKITNVWIAKHAKNNGIDTRTFWKDSNDETIISVDDILSKKMIPNNSKYENYVIAYAKQLLDFGRTGICLRDEKERFIDPRLDMILKDIPNEIFIYGQNMFTETISIFESVIPIKNDAKTFGDEEALDKLEGYDQIILCGDQLAVHLTARTLGTKHFPADKIFILEDVLCENPCFHGYPNLHIIQSNELR